MLSNKALLVRLHISQWYNQASDQRAVEDVAARFNIQNSEDRYVKRLIPGAAMVSVRRAAAALRQFHNTNTLPWSDDSIRVLSTKNFFIYQEGMAEKKNEFENAVRDFVRKFPEWIEFAKTTKGALFDIKQYPTPEELRSQFRAELSLMPFPNTADFRIDLEPHEVERIRKEAEQSVSKLMASANDHLLDTLRERVTLLYNALSNPFGIIRDATFQSILDTADLIDRMNVTENTDLQLATAAARTALADTNPDRLRTNPNNRDYTAHKLKELLKATTP